MEAAAHGAAREAAGGGGKVQRAGEALMDQYLSSQGLYRKKIAKDGSCLFRAVAEQVLHSQARHYDVRIACINYLRENRNNFEAFIEGQFEEYLKRLENPQEWVGQVEISALSLMYKKDFVIYQEPNAPPSCVTENQFPDKIMLCFSNGNHYDIVYPATYPDSAALCQSIIYEMLYEKVFSTDVGKALLELDDHAGTKEENCVSDEESESDTEDRPRNKNTNSSNMNGFKSHSGKKQLHNNGNPTYLFLSQKVICSLSPALYRNVEYDVWLKLKRDQQKRDFSMAAGMQYSVGDKCKVRLEPSGKFYDAHIQDVSSENGPVVVFVQEFGKKYDVLLKSLKPIPQGTTQSVSREAWNTVSGKKIKRSSFGSEAECRGQKTTGKPVKPQSTLPPRLQQAAGNRQQHYSTSPGPASQHIPIEHRNPNRTSTQATGSRKLEREKSEEFDYYSKDCNYFGLSPEERRERQAIEESRSLYEMQHLDEQAFPALSSQVQTGEVCNQRKLNVNNEKTPKQKLGLDECKDSNSEINHPDQSEATVTVEVRQKECLQTTAASVATSSVVTPSCANPAPLEILPDPEHPMLPVVPPVVPLMPDTVPVWHNEPAAYSATGVTTQMSASPVIPAPSGAPEPATAQAHGPPAQFSSLPVPLQAVNPPMMPLPPTLNPYQDPLYPGFPVDENGERGTVPPYSLCKGGDDLPKDKGILRFFFNLGLKAYSCPMWAPHSYLYPLHQMYLNLCRMYPKVPVYPHNAWFQEVGSTDIEHSPHANLHSPIQNEGRITCQHLLGGVATSPPPPPPPWFVSTVQIPSNTGPAPNVCGIEATENLLQPAPAIYADSPVNKSIYPQQALGHSSFLGPVPLAHSFYPPVWYGYPMQGFAESPNMQHTVVASDTQSDRNKEYSSPILEQNHMEQFHEDNAVNPSTQQATVTSVESELPQNGTDGTAMQAPKCKPVQPNKSKPLLTTTPKPPKRAGLPDVSIEGKEIDRHVVVPNPSQEDVELSELAKTTVSSSEKKEMHEDPQTPVGMQSAVLQSRIHRTRDESSEDEREVSDMLRSGRSKNFYNQTYGARKYRSDRGYAPSRGGFHYHRNDEGWRGQSSRNREEGHQPYRGFRGRPYRSENRRRPTSDLYRGHQDHDGHGQYQKPN